MVDGRDLDKHADHGIFVGSPLGDPGQCFAIFNKPGEGNLAAYVFLMSCDYADGRVIALTEPVGLAT